jgi:hypothetical protein
MSDKRSFSSLQSSWAFILIAIAFLGAAIVLAVTRSSVWITFFAIAMAFLAIGAAQRRKAGAEESDPE